MHTDKGGSSSGFSSVRICGHLCLILFFVSISLAGADIRGVSLANLGRGDFGYGSDDCCQQLAEISSLGANWVAVTDLASMPAVDQPELRFGRDRQRMRGNLIAVIKDAHLAGLKVLVKPHVWSRQFGGPKGIWPGDIKMTSDADWEKFFENYGQFILFEAAAAAEAKADALSVGCELQAASHGQEARWRKLVTEVRKIYPGPLTYACAFNEWPEVKWFDALDWIGINAYFPLVDHESASEEALRAGWTREYERIEPFAKRLGKPVCITELGYNLSSDAGQRPWVYDVKRAEPAYQARLYKVALEEAAKRECVNGVFVWKWFTSERFAMVDSREPFLVQDKPMVLEVLKNAWKR